ncbi:MAG: hypothetical protein J6S67_21485 [Methanobrevibacter sp.]|nr:hypothetical protein [Methanobrevibacter sp.]
MDIKQVATIVNGITAEILGENAVVNEDLSNVVDIGKAIFDNVSYDKYVKTLVDHIGRVIFVDRKYTGGMASLYRDNFEYGAVLEKITGLQLPNAVENSTWNLTDGASYDPFVFHKPDVAAKFFNKKTTFEVDLSIADKQAKSAFSSATQLNAFVSMLTNDVDKSLTVKQEGLAQRTINNLILQTIQAEFPSVADNDYSGMTGVKAINLLKLYNDQFSPSPALTAANCLYSPEFIRYSTLVVTKTLARMKKISSLFNVGELPRFTPADKQHLILLSDFKAASDVYLQSDTFHNTLVDLPMSEDVAYWQGSGTTYDLTSISTVHGEIDVGGGSTKEINLSGVLGVAFDHDAAGITNLDRRVTSAYNPKAEFNNFFYKVDCGYFNDLNENCVIFYVQ